MADSLNKLSLPLNLVPDNEKQILQSMCEAAIGNGVGRNYVFSRLGRFINTAQLAYFNSPPSRPLVDGLLNSDTDDMLNFFEESKEISYHVLWDVVIPSDNPSLPTKTALVSSIHPADEVGHEIDHTGDEHFDVPWEMASSA